MALLEVEGLSFTYPGTDAPTLQDVAFTVVSGGSLALLGSSGAGKTTLLNLLSGLLPCTTGRIAFQGVDVSALSAAKRGVAQVFQFPVLYDSLTVQDNIGFPLRTRGVGRRERRQRAQQLAELFDLQTVLTLKPAALSLFQKQLVGFAKALVRNDLQMVLLDEPLTAVEPAMKWRLRGAVKRAQQELGVTMVYVTHDQTEALTFADTVSVLHDGKLLQTATPSELYAAPAHSEVARFIGNPGMNLVPATLLGEEISAEAGVTLMSKSEIGFRPEWASLVAPATAREAGTLMISGTVVRTRLTGASARGALGITTVAIDYAAAQPPLEIQVATSLDYATGSTVSVLLQEFRIFQDSWRVAS